jgi:hypothetical protein
VKKKKMLVANHLKIFFETAGQRWIILITPAAAQVGTPLGVNK